MTVEGSGVFGMSTMLLSCTPNSSDENGTLFGGEGKETPPGIRRTAIRAASEAVSTPSGMGWAEGKPSGPFCLLYVACLSETRQALIR